MPPKKTVYVQSIPSAERFGTLTIIQEVPMPGEGQGHWTSQECFDQAAHALARITPESEEDDHTPTAAETDRFTRISAAWKELGKALKDG